MRLSREGGGRKALEAEASSGVGGAASSQHGWSRENEGESGGDGEETEREAGSCRAWGPL